MTFIANQLREKIQIRTYTETANDDGGFDRGYTTLKTIWGSLKPLSDISNRTVSIRGVQTEVTITHKIKIRKSSVDDLGSEFSAAFDSDFNSIKDISPIKSHYFFFVERGSSVKGKLYKIHHVIDDRERREFLVLLVEELEEKGTGWE